MAANRPKAFVVRQGESTAVSPPFTESIIDALSGVDTCDSHCIDISYCLAGNRLCVAPRECDSVSDSLHSVLARPTTCPFHELHSSREVLPSTLAESTLVERDVAVAATILLESSDNAVLITQRAAHMRTYPLVWVVPGGHVEEGESFEEAAFREVAEETGLTFSDEERATSRLLCLWESAYPALLSQGVPRRHHLIAYISVKCSSDTSTLLQRMKSSREEVCAVSWISLSDLASALNTDHAQLCFKVHSLGTSNKEPEARPMSALFQQPPAGSEPWEHLSSGTQFAIEQILKDLKS